MSPGTLRWLVAAALCSTAASAAASPGAILRYETGPAYIAQNDGRYGTDGTPFEASDVGQQRNLLRGERASVELVTGRHRIIALYAPFSVDTQLTVARDFQFRDTLFPAGSVLDHRYRFDGYRASYLYQVVAGRVGVELGGSLQIRDADVAFASVDGARRDNEANIGLVPALKARVTLTTASAWAALEFDGLSTFGLIGDTSGALYDAAVTAGFPVRHDVDLYGTLRLLGGGAEVPSKAIDNWGNFVSASLGLRVRLGG
ncbi:MAG: hypothetical protein K8W52_39345 [Deltaproteobacteria bacterium]|nr:hypothetical protein [Deltaproteobacteria bacterium]